MRAYLYAQGFQRVLALHPQVCGLESADATLWICLWGYQAAEPADRTQGEIHPYYPASQRAYLAARQAVAEGEKRGLHLRQDTELRLKPLFAHLRGFSQGRNTLSSVEGMGSRFHVQVLWMSEEAEACDDALWEDASHGLSCGACKACLAACPTGGPGCGRLPPGALPAQLDAQRPGRFRRKCGRPWETCLWGAMPASDAVPKTQACRGDPAQALRWITCCAHPRMPHSIWRRRLASTWQSQTESWDRHCLLRATVETKHCCHW